MEEYLQRIAAGDIVILIHNGVAVAEIHRTAALGQPPAPRPVGLARGKGTIPPTFFEPLPADLAALFSGEEPSTGMP